MLDYFDSPELPEDLKNDRLLQAQGGNPRIWHPLIMGTGFEDAAVDRIIEAAAGNQRMVTHIAEEAVNRYNRAVVSALGSGGTPPPVRSITKEEIEAIIREVESGTLPLQNRNLWESLTHREDTDDEQP